MGQIIAESAGERVVRVILLGERTWETCATGNCILGRDYRDRELEWCKAGSGMVDSKLVTVGMTPGWRGGKEDEYDWSTVREHVELLGGARVWAHTLVIFCCWDEWSRRGLEEKGKQLRLVREECGGRYHVINVNNRDGAQVTELLEKIMTMVKGHGGGYFVPEAETNSEDSVRPEDEEERAESTALIGGEVK
ncbi:hypothetical protein AAFF_G00410670 [Aldrovandia affinis]|uniref:AIG1-type G domain-containing protein n=1 Tax=Aldrovandia affinis TaxID=143900 RepID=A0AAD7R3H2_9TELE|nr:hypothetical protein AAFF_G00410670 [Aldrovandia affinis]